MTCLSRKVGRKKCRPRRCRMFRFCARVVPRAPPPLNRDLQANEKMSIAAPAQKLLRIVFRTYMSFPGFANPKNVLSGAGVSPGDVKRPFSRKRNKISIAAMVRNVLRIRFPSLVRSLGQREQGHALFHVTPDIPVNSNKLIRAMGSRMKKCAN